MTVVIPSGSYGIEAYDDKIDDEKLHKHHKRIAGFYWKKWCGVSNYVSTSKLTETMFNEDPQNIQKCNMKNRRMIALFYADALHVYLCNKEKCYKLENHDVVRENGFTAFSVCKCRLCGEVIEGTTEHVMTCPNLPERLMAKLEKLICTPTDLVVRPRS